jgi:hypothetical protein
MHLQVNMKKLLIPFLFLSFLESFGMNIDMAKLLLEKAKVKHQLNNPSFLQELNLLEPQDIVKYEKQLSSELYSSWRRPLHFVSHGILPLAAAAGIGWVAFSPIHNKEEILADRSLANIVFSGFIFAIYQCCSAGLTNM